tara:strand:- start:1424 stop:2023 length:600 start_codon:yes stop_codon:yes gene_type:complete
MSDEKPKSNHYIDNKEFYAAMIEWKTLVTEAEESGADRPPVTDYIGKCFVDIAEHLSYRPNFINYPYRDDMIGDGIENCLMYAHNFNPEKSKNPFSYFTQIIYYAFLRRIEKEKKQAYVKFKVMENMDDSTIKNWYTKNYFDEKGGNHAEEMKKKDMLSKHFQLTDTDIEKFTPKKKKKKTKKSNLDSVLEDKNEDSTD